VRAVSLGLLRAQPGQLVLAILAVAIGVALGSAVHWINRSALAEFERAAREAVGEADLIVRGPREGFDERLYPRLARRADVAVASPMLEIDASLAGRPESLRVLGIDPFRAGAVQPDLYARLAPHILELFEPGTIVLTAAAATRLGIARGDTLGVRVGAETRALRVIDVIATGAEAQRLGFMDIANAQLTFRRLGRVNRIDLRLRAGVEPQALAAQLAATMPPGVQLVRPEIERNRGASLTRAYRVNLEMLALVALVTGAFVVYATQALAIMRRRAQLAVLRLLGVTRRSLLVALLGEGLAIGLAGAVLGIAAGLAIAAAVLARLGPDLGGGFFRGVAPSLDWSVAAVAGFLALGAVAALAGTWVAASAAVRAPPALALKSGDADDALVRRRPATHGLLMLGAAALFALLPPVGGLPVGGYAAVALALVGAVMLVPAAITALLPLATRRSRTLVSLGAAQLVGQATRASLGAAGIVVSFSLMVAMAIMVQSLRHSLEDWLGEVLPADVRLRAAGAGESASLSEAQQAAIAALPQAERVELVRSRPVLLDPAMPAVTLLALPITPSSAAERLPLVASRNGEGEQPAWISEPARDLHGLEPGDILRLPLEGRAFELRVAGVWRDYARPNGALVVDLGWYRRATGDRSATDVSIWLASGATQQSIAAALRTGVPGGEALEIASSSELRALSLRIFDRTFLITRALEGVAILIGLFGVAVAFASQAIARRGEFGLLRHIGLRRRDVVRLIAGEGVMVTALGAAIGLALGVALSVILVHVINRQSFHWSMDFSVPWRSLISLTLALIAAATLTAVLAGRRATSADPIRAVREDW
jgi:putative ABC transport system permease protein